MVVPSPTCQRKGTALTDKAALRVELRQRRLAHEAQIPAAMRSLLFHRPPAPLLALVPEAAVIGVYYPVPGEASPLAYARWLAERGNPVALPWFAARGAAMQFKLWDNPFEQTGLVPDPYGAMQPEASAQLAQIDVAIVPVLGFTAQGQRLGQGGGHYDRYLAANPHVVPIGLAWDCQLVSDLPAEPHDVPLRAVITPTRFYGPY